MQYLFIILFAMSGFKVELQGSESMRKMLKELGSDTYKKRVLVSAYRKAAKPFIKTARAAAPVASKPVMQRGKEVKPGTLRKSVNTWTYRKIKAPHLLMGAKMGKRSLKYDGWYYRFIEFGTVYQAPKPFLQPAWNATKGQASTIIEKEMVGILEKFKRKNGLK